MKRVYGLRDNTTEHSEYKRLEEQLMRPEWAQLRREWKWAVTQKSAHGQRRDGGRPTIEVQVLETRVDLSNDMTGRDMLAVGVRNVVLAR